MSSVLHATALSKHYGKQAAVDRINLKIQPGRIVGLIGPNGSGKTTTLKAAQSDPEAQRGVARRNPAGLYAGDQRGHGAAPRRVVQRSVSSVVAQRQVCAREDELEQARLRALCDVALAAARLGSYHGWRAPGQAAASSKAVSGGQTMS